MRYNARRPGATVSAVCRELGLIGGGSATSGTASTAYTPGGSAPARGARSQCCPRSSGWCSVAISAATWGCARIAGHLRRAWQVQIAPNTVQRTVSRRAARRLVHMSVPSAISPPSAHLTLYAAATTNLPGDERAQPAEAGRRTIAAPRAHAPRRREARLSRRISRSSGTPTP
jgi:hypothetical protein